MPCQKLNEHVRSKAFLFKFHFWSSGRYFRTPHFIELEAMKELNHSKNTQGFSPPSSILMPEYQVREAKSTSLKVQRMSLLSHASIRGHPLNWETWTTHCQAGQSHWGRGFSVHQNHLEGFSQAVCWALPPRVSDSVGLDWDQEFANLKSSQVPVATPWEPQV